MQRQPTPDSGHPLRWERLVAALARGLNAVGVAVADVQAKVEAALLHFLYEPVILPPLVVKLERGAVEVGEEAATSCPPAYLAPLSISERQRRSGAVGWVRKTVSGVS